MRMLGYGSVKPSSGRRNLAIPAPSNSYELMVPWIRCRNQKRVWACIFTITAIIVGVLWQWICFEIDPPAFLDSLSGGK